MELAKKTTILFPPDLYDDLARIARQRRTTVAELVRTACRVQYGLTPQEDRLTALRELIRLELPVGTPEHMERESVPPVEPVP